MHIHIGRLPPLRQTLRLRRTKGHHHCLEWKTHVESLMISMGKIVFRMVKEEERQPQTGETHHTFCSFILTSATCSASHFQDTSEVSHTSSAAGQRFGNLSLWEMSDAVSGSQVKWIRFHFISSLSVIWLAYTVFQFAVSNVHTCTITEKCGCPGGIDV